MRRLNKRYGDKDLAVLSTMYRLESLKLMQGPAHKKMEMAASELSIAKTRLEAVGAEPAHADQVVPKPRQAPQAI